MTEAVVFLQAFGHALSAMMLYSKSHPSRECAVDDAHRALSALCATRPGASFTFVNGTVLVGSWPLTDLRSWAWSTRLAEAGIGRLDVERRVSRHDLHAALEDVLDRLAHAESPAGNGPQRRGTIRLGPPEAASEGDAFALGAAPVLLDLGLGAEADACRWLQRRAQSDRRVRLADAEAVVRSLLVAMHGDRRLVLPLLRLEALDAYPTTHALNVSVLAMGLVSHLGCTVPDVRGIGVAGLLCDVGMLAVPVDLLTTPESLSPEDVAVVRAHPVDGARMLWESGDDLGTAAIVAHEHHRRFDGTGYPHLQYARESLFASRVVAICDVYDALCSRRPHRQAWTPNRAAAYLRDHAGTEFDPQLVDAFTAMLAADDVQVVVLRNELEAVRASAITPVAAVSSAAEAPGRAATPTSSDGLTIEFL